MFQAHSLEMLIQQCSLLSKVLCVLLEHHACPVDQLGQLDVSEELKKSLEKVSSMLAEVSTSKLAFLFLYLPLAQFLLVVYVAINDISATNVKKSRKFTRTLLFVEYLKEHYQSPQYNSFIR